MHNQVPNRGLIHGVIPVSRARTVLFLSLLLPMACGFGWEVMTAFRDAHGVTPMTVAEIENASLRSGNVAIRGIDPARTASKLVRDTELDNVWVVYPNDPTAKAKNHGGSSCARCSS